LASPSEMFDAEYRIVRPDNGEVRWISCRTKFVCDDEGKPVRTIGSHRDITSRRNAEETLRRNEERLRLVKEATGLADFEAGPDGFVHVSHALIDKLGLPPDTVELPFAQLLEYIHPDDRAHLQSEIEKSLESQGTFDCVFRIVHGVTGEVRWIHSRT